jgi:hypothetical protein
MAKGRNQNIGLYQPLPIPERPCEDNSVDFFLGFPRTQGRHDSIFVVAEIFLKMVHFIPCLKISDVHVVNLFFKEVVKLYGLPKSMVSKKDAKFVGHFWRTLWKNLKIDLKFISTHHP